MTTEEMVIECFNPTLTPQGFEVRKDLAFIARAARRFVRMENKQAMKRVLKVCDEIDKENLKRRVHINYDTKTAMKLKRKSKSNPAKGVR